MGEVAKPDPSVVTVAVVPSPAKVPLAPEAGALNMTLAPEIALPLASFTAATNLRLNAAPTFTLCPPPDVAVMLLGAPAVFVKANVAGLETSAVDAVTV